MTPGGRALAEARERYVAVESGVRDKWMVVDKRIHPQPLDDRLRLFDTEDDAKARIDDLCAAAVFASALPVARVEETCAAPRLFVHGVRVPAGWIGCMYNADAHSIAAEINEAALKRLAGEGV